MKQLFWNYGESGAHISLLISAVGTAVSIRLGGFDDMLGALVSFMAADLLLGVLAAAKTGSIDSKVMFWGGVNKLLVLMFVGIGVVLDCLIALEEPYLRTAVIWFYLGREGLSIVENYGRMGLPLPQFISSLLAQLKDKGDNGKT